MGFYIHGLMNPAFPKKLCSTQENWCHRRTAVVKYPKQVPLEDCQLEKSDLAGMQNKGVQHQRAIGQSPANYLQVFRK